MNRLETFEWDKNSEDIGDPLQLFNDFYRQIVFIKRAIEEQDLSFEVAKHQGVSATVSADDIAEYVSAKLHLWLDKKRKQAKKQLTDKEYARINEALFVSAALADELFILVLDWPGKKHWHSVLLEEKLFQSSFAGERFFQNIALLLNERVLDQQQRNLLAVYFLAMRLGFDGRYRDEPKRLDYIRKKLFKRMNGGMSDEREKICPQAYRYLLASAQESRLAPLARWKKTMAQALILYLLFSVIAWNSLQGVWNANV